MEARPNVLNDPLEFGNLAQIEALRVVKNQIADQEERTREIKEGLLKEYFVAIRFTGETTEQVWATSQEEAEDIAGLHDFEPDEFEIASAHAREVVGKPSPDYRIS